MSTTPEEVQIPNQPRYLPDPAELLADMADLLTDPPNDFLLDEQDLLKCLTAYARLRHEVLKIRDLSLQRDILLKDMKKKMCELSTSWTADQQHE